MARTREVVAVELDARATGWAFRLPRAGRVHPKITHIPSLEDINEGFDLMHAGESLRSVVAY